MLDVNNQNRIGKKSCYLDLTSSSAVDKKRDIILQTQVLLCDFLNNLVNINESTFLMGKRKYKI